MRHGLEIEEPEFNLNVDEEYKEFLSVLAGQIEMKLECDQIYTDTSVYF